MFADIREGFRFVLGKPEILGSYLIDIVAMLFAFPLALFPAMSQSWGGPHAAGLLYSSLAIGALLLSLFSGWTNKVTRNGAAVVVSASFLGIFYFVAWFCTAS